MKTQWMKSGMLVSALLVAGAMPVEGQGVEAIMRARERLELTDQQVQQLDAIRRDAVSQRTAEQAQIAELRSQLAAGQIRRSDLMAAMEDQQDAREGRAEQRQARIDAVLTETQRESVQQMRRRADRQRPGVRGQRPAPGRGAPGVGPRRRFGLAPQGGAGPGGGAPDFGPPRRIGR